MTLIPAPQLLLIGSGGRNAGKTTLATALISRWKGRFPITALKVTTISHPGICHRGGHGCGACTELGTAAFRLDQETTHTLSALPPKDTAQLLNAGAGAVYWLRAGESSLREGYTAFLEQARPRGIIICESNSLREVVVPGCFLMLIGGNANEPMKPSAARVAPWAHIVITSAPDHQGFDQLAAGIQVAQDGDRFWVQPGSGYLSGPATPPPNPRAVPALLHGAHT